MKIKETLAVSELRSMIPYLLILNAVTVVVCVIIGIVSGFDWRLYTGLAVGNALMVANFLLIGYTAERVVHSKDFRRGRSIAGMSYGLRYVGIFVILAGLLTIKVINPITAVVPLIFPRVFYTFFYVRMHKEDDQI